MNLKQTLSIRLLPSTIAGAYDIMVLDDDSARGTAIGTVIAEVISFFVDIMREQGNIPKYETEAAALLALKEYLPLKRWPDSLAAELNRLPSLSRVAVTQLESPARTKIREAVAQVEQNLDTEAIKDLSSAPTLIEATQTTPKDSGPPWEMLPHVLAEMILEIMPDNKLLQEASENKDPLFLAAIEVGYAKMPQTLWDKDDCETMVRNLYKQFKVWEEKNGQN